MTHDPVSQSTGGRTKKKRRISTSQPTQPSSKRVTRSSSTQPSMGTQS
ncbi:unnamed protein product [Cuscuta europaea]|uniref:Uncharacterized protein n=1 Tax=Cuscuta europaea TaxID=41803 RepID=A0A9P0Z6U2_CUSEU|nr:unnamed protein product [Cuscuta europaea]